MHQLNHLCLKAVILPEQGQFMNERFVSEETTVSRQCKSETLKFGINQVGMIKGSNLHRGEIMIS